MIRERTIADLEFEQVLSLVRRHSLSEGGKEKISPSAFTSDESVIASRASRIEEILERIIEGKVSLSPFVSLSSLFETYERKVPDFDGRDIYLVSSFIAAANLLAAFEENDSLLSDELRSLGKEISSSLSPDGSVLETHPLLKPLYRALESERLRRQTYAQSYMAANSSLFQSGEAVYRNERIALPVKRERKSEVAGYVQGSSATGSTLFVEPFELVELNNKVVLAEDEIVRMKHKILSDLSKKVRNVITSLRELDSYAADFDFHYSFALFVKETRSSRVTFSSVINLDNARHPLLFDKAVPISLSLGEGVRIVVLSGPNAGGKTVTMKTVALFSLLAQTCGFAPFDEGSTLPLFTSVYTDIGDGQSILENFSTFSSHMANVASICRVADEKSLVLLDEIGSGTDPAEGAALTDSILDYFKTKGSMLFITSHYSQVKMHAYSDKAMLNASMDFDESSSRPTFRVIAGLPGDSHAIATAKKMGLPPVIIKQAKESLSSSSSVASLISALNGKSRALDRKVSELSLEKKKLEAQIRKSEEKERELDEMRLRLQREGADELRVWMKDKRRELEHLVKDVSTGALTKEKTKAVRTFISSLEEKSRALDAEVDRQLEKANVDADRDFKPGDEVLCGSFSRRGIILRAMGRGRYQVSIDSMKITLPASDLRPAPEEKKATVSPFKSTTKMPSLTLDLRGKTLAEALDAIAEEIEACLVHSASSFSIIHGYGNGILSQGIHAYLKKQKDVKNYYFANPEDGGMGKTYVMLQ